MKTHFMAAPVLDNEFMQYWSKLTVTEKESLLSVAKQYVQLKSKDADDLRKQLVMEERAIYLKGEGKSFSWDEVKDMTDTKKFKLSANQLKMVEQEKEKHVKGKSKSYSWPEAKEVIRGKRKL